MVEIVVNTAANEQQLPLNLFGQPIVRESRSHRKARVDRGHGYFEPIGRALEPSRRACFKDNEPLMHRSKVCRLQPGLCGGTDEKVHGANSARSYT